MRSAERTAFAYFNACPEEERVQAALIHEGVYCAMQIGALFRPPGGGARKQDFSR
jgi:hypothetical protein